ncbi:SDR family oxidoreductase [Solirubrobacter soli]|uniref:SDR family oxidoreductase n=1 Tax=Solirubrobacter soli TaxID=363832 RepID=UPI0004259F48|nr:SDR family oxidoreductase [Solirubrobacter soli]
MPRAALVTGGAQGIGEAIARRLAADGVRVCVADLDGELAAAVADSIGGIAATVDVRRVDDLQAAASAAVDAFGGLSILVNNAGMTRNTMLHKLTDEDWQLIQDVNLGGAVNGLRAVSPWFRELGGDRRVVNIASIAGVHGSVGAIAYSAAKAGVVGLTRTAAKEWARFGVTVNAVAPGIIATRMTDAFRDDVVPRIPLGRAGTPEDVAEAVAFFCSPRAGYITGQVLEVAGGVTDVMR